MESTEFKEYLETRRCCLRALTAYDVNEAYVCWMNDPRVSQYLESRFTPHSLQDLKVYVEKTNADPNSRLFGIFEKEAGLYIGNVKISLINWLHRHAELGILIGHKAFWGKGYATEVLAQIVDYAGSCLNLRKLTAGIYANNIGSIKAFEKVGFEREGIIREQYFFKGGYVDGIRLGILLQG